MKNRRRGTKANAEQVPADERWSSDWEAGVRVWVERGGNVLLNQELANLLAAISATASITAGARLAGVSYRHAWKLVQEGNAVAGEPLVLAAVGGRTGGGATLTLQGKLALEIFERLRGQVGVAAADLLQRSLLQQEESPREIHSPADAPTPIEWAWRPSTANGRFWLAKVHERWLRYPCESALQGATPHDGASHDPDAVDPGPTPPTLTMACCDPAIGLLATELARQSDVRLLAFFRSSRQALALLRQGAVHLAGIHLGGDGSDGNLAVVRETLGAGYRLLRLSTWEDGAITAAENRARSASSLAASKARWVGRERGSGARQCLEELLGEERRYRRMASDHRGVVEAVRGGWADAGVAPRMIAEEAGLRFLPVRVEAFDLCYREDLGEDRRFQSLLATLQSARYRRLLGELPGYDSCLTGELIG